MDENKTDYDKTKDDFVHKVYSVFSETNSEITERNERIEELDEYVYGDRLETNLDIPFGHDFTPVNWLRRTVEIHKNMFMGRGFQAVSTYDSKNLDSAADEEDRRRMIIENKKAKENAENRQKIIEAIKRDNGGDALWNSLAENASAVGDSVVKTYYDEEEKKFVICPVEAVENFYVLWDKDNFRDIMAVAFIYQVSVQEAIEYYGVPADVPTSRLGEPLSTLGYSTTQKNVSSQKMVTVIETTGKIPSWKSSNGKLSRAIEGQETLINAIIVGNQVYRLITDKKKIPKYYRLPNKQQRRRPWGVADISEAAIKINLTYIETLSDWRTHASKVNFQKYKAYNFGMDTQLPKYEERQIQVIPLAEGQDITRLDQGDANGLDFRQQMDELKEQFVRETGISRVLFDDPSVTLNSNQALLTSMKPTSDIAEAKKQLWSPILSDLFIDALETIAEYDDSIKELIDGEDWSLKIMWPSVMQKEDPVYQQMLLNRFTAGTMSVQSFLEAQGETKEEIDRMRDEMSDIITAAILGQQRPLLAQTLINANTAEVQAWYQSIMTPEQPQQTPGINANGGTQTPQITPTAGNNQPGQGLVSQPGSGATPVSPGGAVAQVNQQNGA